MRPKAHTVLKKKPPHPAPAGFKPLWGCTMLWAVQPYWEGACVVCDQASTLNPAPWSVPKLALVVRRFWTGIQPVCASWSVGTVKVCWWSLLCLPVSCMDPPSVTICIAEMNLAVGQAEL
nr:unknown [Sea turtle tornovirus 1]